MNEMGWTEAQASPDRGCAISCRKRPLQRAALTRQRMSPFSKPRMRLCQRKRRRRSARLRHLPASSFKQEGSAMAPVMPKSVFWMVRMLLQVFGISDSATRSVNVGSRPTWQPWSGFWQWGKSKQTHSSLPMSVFCRWNC